MWPLFNRAHFLFITCLLKCSPYTSKNWSGFLSERFKTSLRKLNCFIKIWNNYHIPPLKPTRKHAGFNKIVALNSTSHFYKRWLFLHAVQLFSILCCGPDLVQESVTRFIRSTVTNFLYKQLWRPPTEMTFSKSGKCILVPQQIYFIYPHNLWLLQKLGLKQLDLDVFLYFTYSMNGGYFNCGYHNVLASSWSLG